MNIDGGRSSGGLLVSIDSEREHREKMSEGTDPIDLESNPDLSEIFEAISKDPLQNKSDLSSESFFLDVDKKIETGASEARKFGRPDINNLLRDLGRNLGVASVVGYQDFAYTEGGTATADPFVEREYWLKLSIPGLGGTDGYAILHVHYLGKFYDPNQCTLTGARSTITQINIRHTWKSGQDVSERYHMKCADLDKWREKKANVVLGPKEAPHGWKWKENSQRELTWFTSSLRDLLEKGEKCATVVRKKYVKYMQGAAAVSSPDTFSRSKPPFEEGVRDAGWVGVRLAALCIGVGAYSGSSRLDNPVRDAEALFKAINNCPDCRAAILRDPQSKMTILEHLKRFLRELAALSADKLPEVVVLSLGGHGMQNGPKVFLIPTEAKFDDEDQCLSHTKVLKCLRDELDVHAGRACKSNRIKFALIMDVCRVPGEFSLKDTISEPDQSKAPGYWSICYSTSRGTVAADGRQGSHSPLALGLLDPQSGIFAPGVSLEQGIKNACESVEKKSGVRIRQRPIKINIDRLGDVILQPAGRGNMRDFILQPAASKKRPSETDAAARDVSEGAGSSDTATPQDEVVAFLKKRGLQRIAERLREELFLEESDDLQYVKEERLNKLEWLEDVPKAKLLKLCREVTARLMSADDSDRRSADDTLSQGASTPLPRSVGSPDGKGFESDGEDVLIAARNVGDCAEFQEHMRRFIQDFQQFKWLVEMNPEQETYDIALADAGRSKWTICMLLWIGFAQSIDAKLEKFLRDKWLEATKKPDQDIFLLILTECLMHPATTHPLWTLPDFKSCTCQKDNAAGIFFTDRFVQHALRGNEERKERWKKEVVNDWFNKTADAAPDFLIRANRFLREDMDSSKGMSIFESVVETHSYVVFLKMSGLVAFLLFGFLEARKLHFASTAGAAGGGRTLLHGFTSFVSSDGHAFSLSRTGMPALDVIVQGLQCLLHLAHTCWDLMGPVKTAQAFLYSLKVQQDAPADYTDFWEPFLSIKPKPLLSFVSLSQCCAVSRGWRKSLLEHLRTLPILSFGKGGVTDADVLRSVGRVASENLREVDLSGCRKIGASGMQNILRTCAEKCLGLLEVNITACSEEAILRAVAIRARAVCNADSALELYQKLPQKLKAFEELYAPTASRDQPSAMEPRPDAASDANKQNATPYFFQTDPEEGMEVEGEDDDGWETEEEWTTDEEKQEQELEQHAELHPLAGDNDTSHTDGLVAAPNPSTPSTPATKKTAAPSQREFDDLKQALADGLKNVEDLQKQNAALKKELEKATASHEADIPKTSTNNKIFTSSSDPSDIQDSSPGDSEALFAVCLAFVKDPEGFFGLGASENYGDLSDEDFKRACKVSVPSKGISEVALKRIFCQLDRDNSGKISLDELTKATEVARHFYKESMVEDVILATLVRLSKRESNGEDLAHLSLDLVCDALKDKVPEALAKRAEEVRDMLGRKEKAVKKQKDQGIGKFAMATYGEATAYDEGLSSIGTPHPNIFEHIQKEATEGPDSTDIFTTYNSGEIHTSPLKEWDFVFDPFQPASVNKNTPLNKWIPKHVYGGNRAPIRLRVFLHATSAMASGIRFGDYKKAHEVPETYPQWLHIDEVDLVKVITLRFVKSQLDAVSLINAFSKKATLKGTYKFEWARMKVGRIIDALSEGLREKDGSASSCSYKFLVGKLTGKDIATEEEIEAILDHYHAKLAEANMSEAEVIGLREYSGPLYFKMNSSLRLVGVHVEMAVMLPCALEICTQDFQQMFKAVVAAVAHVEPKLVSMDFVSELHTVSTRIEVSVGVPPQPEGAEQVRTRLTELAINSELAHYQEMASVLAAAVLVSPIGAVQPVFVEGEVAEAPTEKVSTKSESSGVQNWLYSEFINAVEAKLVKKVAFSADGERVLIVDIDGNRFKLDGLTPNDPSLLDTLRKKKVDITVLPDRISNISVDQPACVVGLSDHLKGNRYVNSIYACSSAMRKISHVSCIPKGRRVFRGMREVKVPKKFVTEKEGGGRGGVDYAFMSTTTRREVAVNYINDKEMPILFECEVDDLNRGCPLSFVSQFPAEDEVLIPAMSYIEMTGNPYVMEASKGSGTFVTVYPGRIHCNQKSQTIEEIQARRKHDVLSTMFYIAPELPRDLPLVVKVLRAALPGEQQKAALDHLHNERLKVFESTRKEWVKADAEDFNTDSVYKERIDYTIEFKHKSIVELSKLVYTHKWDAMKKKKVCSAVCVATDNKADELNTDNFVHVMSMEGRYDLAEAALSVGFTGDATLVRRDGATTLALAILLPDRLDCKWNMLAILAGNSKILNLMLTTKINDDYLRQLSLAFFETSNIHRWLMDGWSPRGLIGVIGALLSSGATLSDEVDQVRLTDVRAFLNRHSDLLQDISPLASLTLSDVVEQLAFQGSDVFATQSRVPFERVDWMNKPQRQHLCRLTIHAGAAVKSVAYSTDGSRMARAEGNDVVVSDAVSGLEVHRFKGHSGEVKSVAFSADGAVIASGSDDKTVRLWDVEKGSCKCTLNGHSSNVMSVAWNNDGTKLASGSYDNTVRIWSVGSAGTFECESTLSVDSGPLGVQSISYSPGGDMIAAGCSNGKIHILDTVTNGVKRSLSGHSDWVLSVVYSPDGTKIASGSRDKTLKIWNAQTGQCVSTLSGHSDCVFSVVYSPDDTKIASGSGDKTLKIWNAQTGQCVSTLTGHTGSVLSVCFDHTGKKLASGGGRGDHSVRLWSTESGAPIGSPLSGHSGTVRSVCFSPDGKHVASGSVDKTVKIWETSTGTCVSTLSGHSSQVLSVCLSPDGKEVASGSGDKTVKIWETSAGTCQSTSGHSDSVWSVAWSPDGKQVASGSSDKSVKIWDTSTGTCQSTLTGHSGAVHQVEFADDGATLVSGGSDGTRYWDVQSGETKSVLEGSVFAFSKGNSRGEKVGKFLITAEGDILRIFKSEGGVTDKADKDTAPVAFFRAPAPIYTVDTSGVHIAVGCQNGEVLRLLATVLLTG